MKRLIPFLFFTIFIFVSCNKKIIPGIFDFNAEEIFKYGETNISPNNLVIFSITQINDYRCPRDFSCVWQGSADITLKFDSPQNDSLILRTYNNRLDTILNFSFELIDVSPYPISFETIEMEDYDVTLIIKKL